MGQWELINFAIKWVLVFDAGLEPDDTSRIQEATNKCLDFLLKNQDKSLAEMNELLMEGWQECG